MTKLLKSELTLYVIIALAALISRLWLFGIVPGGGGINQDEAMAAYDAYALSLYGTDRFGMSLPVHFTAWIIGQMSTLLSYLMIPFIKIFGFSTLVIRLPMLIVSLISLEVARRFIYCWFGKMASWICFAYLAIAPWHIMMSRWALDCNLLPHFLLFGFYFLTLGIQKKSYFYYLSAMFFGLSMYTYGIAWYSVPLMMMAVAAFLIWKKVKISYVIGAAGVYFLVALPIFIVMIINYFQLETVTFGRLTMPYFEHSIRSNDILFFSSPFFTQLQVNWQSFYGRLLMQTPDAPWNSVPAYGPFYKGATLLIIPALAGMYYGVKNRKLLDEKEGTGAVLVLIWLGIAIIACLIVNNGNINRMNIALYPLSILIGLGISYLVVELQNSVIFKKFGVVLLIAFFAISFFRFTASYLGEHDRNEIERRFYKGFKEALWEAESTVEILDGNRHDILYVSTDTQGRGAHFTTEILTLFYLTIDPKWYQGNPSESGAYYRNRVKYVNFQDVNIADLTGEKRSFIFTDGDVHIMDEELRHYLYDNYKIVQFERYMTAVPN